jgi:hypothetical protein
MIRVLYVPLDDAPAQHAVWQWLAAARDVDAVQLDADRLEHGVSSLRPDVIWIDSLTPSSTLEAIASRGFTTPGQHGFLLTGGAVVLPARLGLEPSAPNDIIDREWRDVEDDLFFFADFAEPPRLRGHAAFRRHRLFDGLGSGAVTWRPRDGEPFRATMYRLPVWPANARVIAVERAFIHVNPDRATIWEYDSPQRVVCIGAYLPFESRDAHVRATLERLAHSALACAAGSGRSGPHDPRPAPRRAGRRIDRCQRAAPARCPGASPARRTARGSVHDRGTPRTHSRQ